MVCATNATWVNPGSNPCQENECRKETFANANWFPTLQNQRSTGICKEGFSLENENINVVRNCLQNGIWDSLQSGKCVENYCEFAENAKVKYERTRQGEVAIGTCVNGYEVSF